jgi:pimeloyl-ACP methyl ester carboxylesterase
MPFLLVHGLSSNARLWDGVARRLAAAGHPAYAVDLRSHGESDSPAEGYDTVTAAADVAAVASRLGLATAVVAGQSWGGNVAVRLAAGHPSLVAALGLVDGGWTDLADRFPDWAACEQALRPPDIDGLAADDVRRFIASEHPDWAAEAVDATLANLRVADGRVCRRLPVDKHMRILRSMWDDPPTHHLAGIDVPALLLPAISDEPDSAQGRRTAVAKAVAALSRAQVREYVGGDHDLHAQQPAAVAGDLLRLAGER